ncbi:MAG: stage III sporulation protein AF [Clostridia bacterium]|nr:stage III sporulation protein AF [Clostridia bacterium]
MEKISMWAQEIITAVLIGSIIQMIIPENKNKKYIKVVVGIYILFCIIKPVAGESIDLEKYDFSKYINISDSNDKDISEYNSNVERAFNERIITSIKNQLNNIGYDSEDINIITDEKFNITYIKINNVKEYKENIGNINRVEINIKDKPARGMPNSDKERIIEFVRDEYNVDSEHVEIN